MCDGIRRERRFKTPCFGGALWACSYDGGVCTGKSLSGKIDRAEKPARLIIAAEGRSGGRVIRELLIPLCNPIRMHPVSLREFKDHLIAFHGF